MRASRKERVGWETVAQHFGFNGGQISIFMALSVAKNLEEG